MNYLVSTVLPRGCWRQGRARGDRLRYVAVLALLTVHAGWIMIIEDDDDYDVAMFDTIMAMMMTVMWPSSQASLAMRDHCRR